MNDDELQASIGRQRESEDMLDVGHARLMEGVMDREPRLCAGDPLPPCWHWLYFAAPQLQSDLGRDGHPKKGDFLPPVPLPRRMWAGSELQFERPALLGERLTRRSTIEAVTPKVGASGKLCFVTVRHAFIGSDDDLRFTERQNIVYREDPAADAPAPPQRAAPEGEIVRRIEPHPTLLFAYSALTFNTHRIHYDRDYCRDVEGYPGLVFHGPLAATLLADVLCEDAQPASLTFRAAAPLFDDAPVRIARRGKEAWTLNASGGLSMHARRD